MWTASLLDRRWKFTIFLTTQQLMNRFIETGGRWGGKHPTQLKVLKCCLDFTSPVCVSTILQPHSFHQCSLRFEVDDFCLGAIPAPVWQAPRDNVNKPSKIRTWQSSLQFRKLCCIRSTAPVLHLPPTFSRPSTDAYFFIHSYFMFGNINAELGHNPTAASSSWSRSLLTCSFSLLYLFSSTWLDVLHEPSYFHLWRSDMF